MKSYITKEAADHLTTSQQEYIKELLALTGGKRPAQWPPNKFGFTGPKGCHVYADVYEKTVNLDINWVDYDTALEIISLLVNRRDQ